MTGHQEGGHRPNQRVIDLFDRFTHGGMDRRQFLEKLTVLAGSSAAAMALLPVLENNYAKADLLPEGDPRIKTETIDVKGTKVYLASPTGGAKWPAVLVIHENRGLNPHIKDVTRRLAAEGFLAGGADFLSQAGGTPADADKAREMIGALDKPATEAAARDVVAALRARPDSNGKVGAIGFCWGGGLVNRLAVTDPTLDAGVAYYGMQPDPKDVPQIKAPLLLHYAGIDDRINAGIPAYEAALKAAGTNFELHTYEGVNHAFNNDTNAARYDKKAADLAWSRTVAFLHKSLG
ncbi:dienelactone hydrolase family protein [Dongia rigui]|uniref:Dienelactone hydrolase family protein n=1 Tax=Dongia rigui TaxID=940149 RepID=A0ABU5E1C7_9PROT|nr:dienelactone hydrolase family protein [Dongia rigui]MDY0873404.1 dienelactone hydrolase family protein [Dongia rigui]